MIIYNKSLIKYKLFDCSLEIDMVEDVFCQSQSCDSWFLHQCFCLLESYLCLFSQKEVPSNWFLPPPSTAPLVLHIIALQLSNKPSQEQLSCLLSLCIHTGVLHELSLDSFYLLNVSWRR